MSTRKRNTWGNRKDAIVGVDTMINNNANIICEGIFY